MSHPPIPKLSTSITIVFPAYSSQLSIMYRISKATLNLHNYPIVRPSKQRVGIEMTKLLQLTGSQAMIIEAVKARNDRWAQYQEGRHWDFQEQNLDWLGAGVCVLIELNKIKKCPDPAQTLTYLHHMFIQKFFQNGETKQKWSCEFGF